MTSNERNALKMKYKRQFIAVKSAIDQWDPYDLLCHAPADEYDSETAMVLSRIINNIDIDSIARVVSEVFMEMFGDEYTADDCRHVAISIKNNLDQI